MVYNTLVYSTLVYSTLVYSTVVYVMNGVVNKRQHDYMLLW